MTSGAPGLDPGWALYRDWCLATSREPLPTTPDLLEVFAARFPAAPATMLRRRRAVLRAHRAAGHPTPPAAQMMAPWPGVAAVLRSVQVRGWPGGVSGRRDGFLIALRLRLTRPELARADAEMVLAALADTPEASDPGGCIRCGLTRWPRVLSVASAGGWRAVQRRMAAQFPAAAGDEAGHDCRRPVRPGWRLMPLLPAVDRHGNVDVTGPISGRAITAATSRRRQQNATGSPGTQLHQPPNPQPPLPRRPGAVWVRADAVRDLHWLDSRLDHLEALVAELNAAINAASAAASGVAAQVDGTG